MYASPFGRRALWSSNTMPPRKMLETPSFITSTRLWVSQHYIQQIGWEECYKELYLCSPMWSAALFLAERKGKQACKLQIKDVYVWECSRFPFLQHWSTPIQNACGRHFAKYSLKPKFRQWKLWYFLINLFEVTIKWTISQQWCWTGYRKLPQPYWPRNRRKTSSSQY